MKKKILATGLAFTMLLSMTACGNKYVSIDSYKELNVQYTQISTEVSEAEVDKRISGQLSSYSEKVTDKKYKAKLGDTVNIDYKGLKDGVAFDGGTAQGYDLTLGSNTFIDGFEEGLVGTKIGQKIDLDLTFPKKYSNADLAGQAVVFEVTVNGITTVPELTDELVAEKIEGYNTVAEYEAGIKEEIAEEKKVSDDNNKKMAMWELILANAKVKSYPTEEVDEIIKDMEEYYTQYASAYGVSLDDFITSSGSTREEFDNSMKEQAQKEVASRLVAEEIAKKEGLELTEEEYKAGLEKYVTELQFESEQALLDEVGEKALRAELLREKVVNALMETCSFEPKTTQE